MTIILRRLAGTALSALAPIVVLISYLALHAAVPDPLPTHWGLHGGVNNTASVAGFFAATLVISAVLALGAAAAIWLAHSPLAGRTLAALLAFGAWITAAITLVTMVASHGASRAQDVAMPWYAIAAVIAVSTVLAAGMWWLLPGRWEPAEVTPAASRLTFAPGERVVWIGHQHSTLARVGSGVLALAGAILLWLQPVVSIPLFVVAVALAMTSELAVRIDERGVHTLWGPFGWPRPRIALGEIASAHAEQIEPMAWGGWGYRVSGRGVAAIIRRGPGLVIERTHRPTYAVTVPGADRGADVLNALLARERSARGVAEQ